MTFQLAMIFVGIFAVSSVLGAVVGYLLVRAFAREVGR